MDWIKKRYDQFLLALVAAALLAFAIMVILKTGSFAEKFREALETVPKNKQIPPLVLDRIEQAKVDLSKPPIWIVATDYETGARGSLFVSQLYILGDEGTPKKPIAGSLRKDTLSGRSIPNKWFIDHGLSPLEATAGLQDPDKDGFLNEDEFRADTDPNNKDSHPPYHTKLFLKGVIRIQFRLIFQTYDGNIKNPQTMNFQINALDLKAPTEFLKLGQTVPKTNYRLDKFEFKEKLNPNTNEMEDVSELTVVNIETGDPVALVKEKITNSPDVYGLFEYEWPLPPQDIRVKKLQDFVLKPEVDKDKLYKLIDIKDTEAVIRLHDGSTYTVTRDPRKAK